MFFRRWFPVLRFFLNHLFFYANPAHSSGMHFYFIFLSTVFLFYLLKLGAGGGGGGGGCVENFVPSLKRSRRRSRSSYGGISLTPLEKFIAAVVSDSTVRQERSFGYGNIVGMESTFEVTWIFVSLTS